ncbi:unnamed protein product [Prorocentrum cordatum]|uniref:Uncharacterized protein n=1 Tax=Prorocentrum cordatum TaxID=2364126 RepID=A0ABN9SLY4_9DINO|nr:unnamed protein product [Polarella glacialis]
MRHEGALGLLQRRLRVAPVAKSQLVSAGLLASRQLCAGVHAGGFFASWRRAGAGFGRVPGVGAEASSSARGRASLPGVAAAPSSARGRPVLPGLPPNGGRQPEPMPPLEAAAAADGAAAPADALEPGVASPMAQQAARAAAAERALVDLREKQGALVELDRAEKQEADRRRGVPLDRKDDGRSPSTDTDAPSGSERGARDSRAEAAARPRAAPPPGWEALPPKPRSADGAVVRRRKELQRERREKLLELRPGSQGRGAPAPLLSCSSGTARSDKSVTPAAPAPTAAWAEEAATTEGAVSEAARRRSLSQGLRGPSAQAATPEGRGACSREVVHAHVEAFHRDAVRREAWKQKFDFLYRQVNQEVLEETNEGNVQNTTSVGAGSSLGPASISLSPRSRASRGTASGRASRGRSANAPPRAAFAALAAAAAAEFPEVTLKPQEPAAAPAAAPEAVPVGDLGAAGAAAAARDARPTAAPNGAWRASALNLKEVPSGEAAAAVPRGRRRGELWEAPAGQWPEAARGRGGLGRLLQQSASTPALEGPREHFVHAYYEGDELLMHEDILSASNPRLFPLRQRDPASFPLQNLVSVP